jgi:tetratricopeptide (TPR) repeat protein
MPGGLAYGQERALLTGRRALQELWLQSMLIGWGRQAVEPLVQALAMPRAALFYAWSGPWGLLAMGGLLGMGALATACVMLSVLRPARRRRRSAPNGAAPIALVVGGLILGGGPMSGATLLVFAGWAALALAAAWRPPKPPSAKLETRNSKFEIQASSFAIESPPRWNASNLGATGTTMLALAAIAMLLAMPARGNRLMAKSQNPREPVADRIDALGRARSLNPFNPAIPMRLAAALREQMDQAPAWSESLYLSVIDAYGAAQRLNPYETTVPMARAQFQVTCKRPEAAMRSIEQAMARQPRAAELCDWMFLASMRLDREQDAWNALDRGLRMAPMSRVWWLRQYMLAGARGQRALADRSLCVALTAWPQDPQLVAEAWRLNQGKDGSTLPGVRLPEAQATPSVAANAEESF